MFPGRTAFVIPHYNHFATVRGVIDRALRWGHPVLVVDDGSPAEQVQALQQIPGITLLLHDRNRGKGAALLTGLAAAAEVADWAVTVDSDGQHDPAEAGRLLQAVPPDQRPIVLGFRQGMEQSHIPWTSRFGRSFSNFWVRLAGGPRVSDSQSGFRLYPLPETLRLAPRSRRFQMEVEILVLARWSGLPVIEAPVSVHYDPAARRISHFHPFLDFWRNAGAFSGLIWRRIFLPAAWRARNVR